MNNKDFLLKGLDYLYNLPPSKWNPAVVTAFKVRLLPKLITYISGETEKMEKDIVAIAQEIFEPF